jgi:phosphotriesterase-related protein
MGNSGVIRTVQGPIKAADLGRTLMHEHILCDFYRTSGQGDQILNDEDLAVDELDYLKQAGGTAVVECTTLDLNRQPEGLRRISERTGLHIIMSTGWYRQPFYPETIDRDSTQNIADHFVQELTNGVAGSAIQAGIIGEIGVNLDYATAQEERVLRAAAKAQRTTGAPLSTHASLYPVGLLQLEILEEEGAELSKVIIGHCDTYLDQSYHIELLNKGAYIQFDTIGREHMNPDDRRADALVDLLRLGWIEKLLLSSDRCYRSDLHAFGGAGYDVVFNKFFQMLGERGVTREEIDVITIGNPSSVLTW